MVCRVIIADDHPLVVSSLRQMLDNDSAFELSATAKTGVDTIAAVKQHRPHLLLLDIEMPDGRGTEVFGECRRWSPDTKIIVLSGVSEHALLSQLYTAGVEAVLSKSCSAETIDQVVRIVLDDGRYLDPVIASHAASEAARTDLTNRELQVLDLIANGLSNARIGERLGVSAKTVDGHRTNLMTKLNTHSVAELVVKAMRNGLLS